MKLALLTFCLITLHLASAETPPAVQVGCCIPIERIEAAKAAGFDYVELRGVEVSALSDEAFTALLARLEAAGLTVPVCNSFLPPLLKVTGPDCDEEAQMKYVRHTLGRLRQLKTELVVLGSGGARQVPEGFEREAGFQQFVQFCRRIAPVARENGVTIVIEPLCQKECNLIINTAEGLRLVQEVNDPNIQLMVDFYHLSMEQESVNIIRQAGDKVLHLHMANPAGRVFPARWDEYDYTAFFKVLRETGYAKRISVEAASKFFEREAPQAIAVCRRGFGG